MLETYTYEGQGTVGNRLDTCPFCGYRFERNERRRYHFEDEHGPEDAGLSPIGERPPEATEPLFRPVEELPGGDDG